MSDFSCLESRRQYYETHQMQFDKDLKKMWSIHWEIELGESDYTNKIAQEYVQKSLDKVWLSEKKFEIQKVPDVKVLFYKFDWWLGQIVGKENIEKEIGRIREKQKDFEGKIGLVEKLQPILDKVTDAVLQLKQSSNNVILAAWFQEDLRKPILREAEKILKEITIEKTYLEVSPEQELSHILASKMTLFRVNAHFRFYYIWRNIVEREIAFENPDEKKIVEEAYLKPCVESDFQVKDNVIAEKLRMLSNQIKEIRNKGVQHTLTTSNFDKKMRGQKDLSQIVDKIAAQRIWEYSPRSIQESLNLFKEIIEKLQELK